MANDAKDDKVSNVNIWWDSSVPDLNCTALAWHVNGAHACRPRIDLRTLHGEAVGQGTAAEAASTSSPSVSAEVVADHGHDGDGMEGVGPGEIVLVVLVAALVQRR